MNKNKYNLYEKLCYRYNLATRKSTYKELSIKIKETGCWEDKWDNPTTDEEAFDGPQCIMDLFELLLISHGYINGDESINQLKVKLYTK